MFAKMFSPNEFTGWHMIVVLFLFFGTIISVNLVLAYYANTTWTGLVVKNSYVASQSFDNDTQKRRAQNALGWDANIAYKNGAFTAEIFNPQTGKITNAVATVKLGRPARESDDRMLTMEEIVPGKYMSVTDLAQGIWQADLTVSDPTGLIWEKSVRFTVGG
ncbi:MAG: FixH family protein [Salaquimonas sp.]